MMRMPGETVLCAWLPFGQAVVAAIAIELIVGQPAIARAAEMARIPAGAFTMGTDTGPEDERPAHIVTLATFEIDILPVTNAQFAQFLAARGTENTRNTRGERLYDEDDNDARIHLVAGQWLADTSFERHPVVEVSWVGARDYCAWLGKRLSSEAEWEKAARGTDARRYPWGSDTPDARRARFAAGWNQTVPVDSHQAGASPYGVLDMAGNAWEWVSSAYRAYPYRADDGRENLTAGPVRGTRGGGHDSSAAEITTTQRGKALSRAPQAGHHNIGFRCAR